MTNGHARVPCLLFIRSTCVHSYYDMSSFSFDWIRADYSRLPPPRTDTKAPCEQSLVPAPTYPVPCLLPKSETNSFEILCASGYSSGTIPHAMHFFAPFYSVVYRIRAFFRPPVFRKKAAFSSSDASLTSNEPLPSRLVESDSH